MKENTYQLHFRFPINSPMKANDKKAFIEYLMKNFSNSPSANQEILDSYYVDSKSEGDGHYFELIIQVITNISTIIGTSFAISKRFKKLNNKPSIFVKRNDGLYAEITDGMNEEEVLKELSKNKKEPNYSVGQVVDVYLGDEGGSHRPIDKKPIDQSGRTQLFIFGPFLFIPDASESAEAIIELKNHSVPRYVRVGTGRT